MVDSISVRPGVALVPVERPGWPQQWGTGQILHALALTRSQAGQATLRIGQHDIPVRTRVSIEAGMRLTLEVAAVEPRPLLRVLEAPAPPITADPLQSALRQALPQQTAIGPLLATLSAVGGDGSAGEALRALAARLLSVLPRPEQMGDPAGLRRALRDSGLFLEAKLATMSGASVPSLGDDLKAGLLRLLRLLPAAPAAGSRAAGFEPRSEPPPPTRDVAAAAQSRSPPPGLAGLSEADLMAGLRQQTEGALARLTLHQNATLERTAEGEARWVVEVPVRQDDGVDVVPLRIERERRGVGAEAATHWTVSLALDLPTLGRLHARIGLAPTGVSSTFWAERPQTAALVRAHLDQLRRNLSAQGLEVSHLSCQDGAPTAVSQAPAAHGLVDERV